MNVHGVDGVEVWTEIIHTLLVHPSPLGRIGRAHPFPPAAMKPEKREPVKREPVKREPLQREPEKSRSGSAPAGVSKPHAKRRRHAARVQKRRKRSRRGAMRSARPSRSAAGWCGRPKLPRPCWMPACTSALTTHLPHPTFHPPPLQARAGPAGASFHWRVAGGRGGGKACGACSGSAAFALLVQGAKPCAGFRLWVHLPADPEAVARSAAADATARAMAEEAARQGGGGGEEAGGEGGGGGGAGAGSGDEAAEGGSAGAGGGGVHTKAVEVTRLAAQLPPVARLGRLAARNMR
jgi:hypothetical protein